MWRENVYFIDTKIAIAYSAVLNSVGYNNGIYFVEKTKYANG